MILWFCFTDYAESISVKFANSRKTVVYLAFSILASGTCLVSLGLGNGDPVFILNSGGTFVSSTTWIGTDSAGYDRKTTVLDYHIEFCFKMILRTQDGDQYRPNLSFKPTLVSYPLANKLITVDSSMLLLCPPFENK